MTVITQPLSIRRWLLLPLTTLPAICLLALLGVVPDGPAQAAGEVTQCADGTEFASLVATGGLVTFDCGGAPVTINLKSEQVITLNTTIDGGGLVTLSGAQATRLFSVGIGVRLTLLNLTLVDGYAAEDGGAIYSHGLLNITQGTFFHNRAINRGASIFAADGRVTLTDTNFISNTANWGGGIVMTRGWLRVQGGQFISNVAEIASGAINLSDTQAIIQDATFKSNRGEDACCGAIFTNNPIKIVRSLFANNVSEGYNGGGALGLSDFNIDTWSLIQSTQFISNHTYNSSSGGAIIVFAGRLVVDDSNLEHNSADESGGAIYSNMFTTLLINTSRLAANTSRNEGGGAIFNIGWLTVTASSFVKNAGGGESPSFGGGAIFSDPDGQLWVQRSEFHENFSVYEGGAIDAGPAYVEGTLFMSNTAEYGGAIGVYDEDFHILNSAFIGNGAVDTTYEAAAEGGAIDTNNVETVWITNTTFFGNYATGNATGGAINGDDGPLTITHGTFYSNTAADGFGGAFSGNSEFVLRNSIVAFNQGDNCTDELVFDGANLQFGDTTCGTALVQQDPLLAPWPKLLGGSTPVLALLAGSPAIDAADLGNCPDTDQRGFRRPFGVGCDLGAFEAWYAMWLPLILR